MRNSIVKKKKKRKRKIQRTSCLDVSEKTKEDRIEESKIKRKEKNLSYIVSTFYLVFLSRNLLIHKRHE